MARGFPSMTALLGLLAVAGYQNRDKLSEMFGGVAKAATGATEQGGISELLSKLRNSLGGAGAGGLLGGGLAEIMERFKQNGHGEAASSWVGTGPNRPLSQAQLEEALGTDTLDEVSKQTGLAREEVLARLSRELPSAVDKYTPQGRLPTEAEFSQR